MNEFQTLAKIARSRPAALSRGKTVGRALLLAFSAFTTGSRVIPMGDNGTLLKSLAVKSRNLSP